MNDCRLFQLVIKAKTNKYILLLTAAKDVIKYIANIFKNKRSEEIFIIQFCFLCISSIGVDFNESLSKGKAIGYLQIKTIEAIDENTYFRHLSPLLMPENDH